MHFSAGLAEGALVPTAVRKGDTGEDFLEKVFLLGIPMLCWLICRGGEQDTGLESSPGSVLPGCGTQEMPCGGY